MKLTILIMFLTLNSATLIFSKDFYKTTTGKVDFTSDAPFELIKAQSNNISGIIDIQNKTFAFKIPVNSFDGFKSSLQQTHFRENYMETDKYPNATFEGKIIDNIDLLQPGTYEINGEGYFNVHGVKKKRTIQVKLTVTKNKIIVNSEFNISLTDHNIKVPSVAYKKIAEEIYVTVTAELVKQK